MKPIRPGRTLGLFVLLYGFSRFILEYIREQFNSYFIFGPIILSHGQFLTIPLFLAGLWLWLWSWRREIIDFEIEEKTARESLLSRENQ